MSDTPAKTLHEFIDGSLSDRWNFEGGTVLLLIPPKLSLEDVDDLEAHFALTIRQLRRRINSSTAAD